MKIFNLESTNVILLIQKINFIVRRKRQDPGFSSMLKLITLVRLKAEKLF